MSHNATKTTAIFFFFDPSFSLRSRSSKIRYSRMISTQGQTINFCMRSLKKICISPAFAGGNGKQRVFKDRYLPRKLRPQRRFLWSENEKKERRPIKPGRNPGALRQRGRTRRGGHRVQGGLVITRLKNKKFICEHHFYAASTSKVSVRETQFCNYCGCFS